MYKNVVLSPVWGRVLSGDNVYFLLESRPAKTNVIWQLENTRRWLVARYDEDPETAQLENGEKVRFFESCFLVFGSNVIMETYETPTREIYVNYPSIVEE